MSAIDFSSMADRYHQHDEPVILDRCNDSVIAASVAPEPLAVAGQRMTEAAWVLAAGDALA